MIFENKCLKFPLHNLQTPALTLAPLWSRVELTNLYPIHSETYNTLRVMRITVFT
jgi:hypothetical protein